MSLLAAHLDREFRGTTEVIVLVTDVDAPEMQAAAQPHRARHTGHRAANALTTRGCR